MWESEDLNGHSLIVTHYGGLLDFCQFSRFVQPLKAAGDGEITAIASDRFRQILVSGGYWSFPRHEDRERESVLYPGIVTINRQSKTGSWAEAVARTKAEILSTI